MTFFFDNNISPSLVKGLHEFGEDVQHLTEKFPHNTPDVDWLKHIGQNHLILITRDDRIRWNPAELKAFKEHQVGAFFLGGKNLCKWDIIQQVIRNWVRIKELAEKERRPYAFRIPPSGTKFTKYDLY